MKHFGLFTLAFCVVVGCDYRPSTIAPPPSSMRGTGSVPWEAVSALDESDLLAVLADPNSPDIDAFLAIACLRSAGPALGGRATYPEPKEWSVIVNDPHYSDRRRHWALEQLFDDYVSTVDPDNPTNLGEIAKALDHPTWLRPEAITELGTYTGWGPCDPCGKGEMLTNVQGPFLDGDSMGGKSVSVWLVLGKRVPISDVYSTLRSGGGPASDVPVKQVGLGCSRFDAMIIGNHGLSPWMVRRMLATTCPATEQGK